MATAEECRRALETFATQLEENRDQAKGKLNFERRLACDLSDLDTAFHGRFVGGVLTDITEGDNPDAEIRMTVGSDDLVALLDGSLDFGPAFANGRVKIKASIMDLLKLKSAL